MSDKKLSTKLVTNHSGGRHAPTVNPPVERSSTLLFENRKDLYGEGQTYGRMGLSINRELEEGMCILEGGIDTKLTPNGLSACTLAIAACVKTGDHLLVSDNAYGPTRRFCDKRLSAMGVDVSYFDPTVGQDIADLFLENTKAIFVETPGSLTFELSDLPAISSAAKPKNISIIADNTWGAGVYYRPLLLGADISVQALTKYVIGHADAFGGAIVSSDREHAKKVKNCVEQWGIALGPDDAYLALRGLRTLKPRLDVHENNALEIAEWLSEQSAVKSILHPAHPSFAQHQLWKRDYSGSNGLFSIVLHDMPDNEFDDFLDGFELFKFGFSWGGYESLLNPADGHLTRQSGDWANGGRPGRLLRIHTGLEDPADLIADLDKAFTRIRSRRSI